MPIDVSHAILQDLPVATLASPRIQTAMGSVIQRPEENLVAARGEVIAHEVYFSSETKKPQTRNNGEEFRSGSAHTKYGTPWIQGEQQPVNMTHLSADKKST